MFNVAPISFISGIINTEVFDGKIVASFWFNTS